MSDMIYLSITQGSKSGSMWTRDSETTEHEFKKIRHGKMTTDQIVVWLRDTANQIEMREKK